MNCLSSCSTWAVSAGFLVLTGESSHAVHVSKYPNVEALIMQHLIVVSEKYGFIPMKSLGPDL